MIAEGIVAASKAVSLKVPLVVRMKGTNEELGRQDARAVGTADHHARTTWPRPRRKWWRPQKPASSLRTGSSVVASSLRSRDPVIVSICRRSQMFCNVSAIAR